MRDEDRTDLPHDQVAPDNEGQMTNEENNINKAPMALEIDERGTGMTPRMREGDTFPEFTPLSGDEEIGPIEDPLIGEEDVAAGVTPFAGGDGIGMPPEIVRERDEEVAGEIAPAGRPYVPDTNPEEERPMANEEMIQRVEDMEAQETGGTALGWTALVLSIISLFFLPLLSASIGIITGFFAYRNGARTLGMWAIAIGLFSIVLGMFFIPLVR